MVAMTAEALAPKTGDGYDVVPLVERLRSRQDRFAEDAQQAVLAQVSGYRALDTPGLRLEVEANCAQVFGIFLDTLAAGRVPTPADFPATAGYGARRIRVGISLEDFLKAYRVGQALLWDHVRAAADGLPGGSVAALTVVAHVMATIEAASSAAARGYLEAENLRTTDAARVERDLLEDLLAGRTPRAEVRTEALADAGLTPGSRVLVGIGLPQDPSSTVPQLPEAAELLSRAVAQSLGGVVVVRQDEVVLVVPVDVLGESTVLSRLAGITEAWRPEASRWRLASAPSASVSSRCRAPTARPSSRWPGWGIGPGCSPCRRSRPWTTSSPGRTRPHAMWSRPGCARSSRRTRAKAVSSSKRSGSTSLPT